MSEWDKFSDPVAARGGEATDWDAFSVPVDMEQGSPPTQHPTINGTSFAQPREKSLGRSVREIAGAIADGAKGSAQLYGGMGQSMVGGIRKTIDLGLESGLGGAAMRYGEHRADVQKSHPLYGSDNREPMSDTLTDMGTGLLSLNKRAGAAYRQAGRSVDQAGRDIVSPPPKERPEQVEGFISAIGNGGAPTIEQVEAAAAWATKNPQHIQKDGAEAIRYWINHYRKAG